MKKICTVIGSRANYSSIKSAMRAIKDHPELELQLVCVASALLDRYGQVVNLIERDGFRIDEKLHILVEGETPATMVKSTGMGLIELSSVFDRLRPDVVITVGDRFETMATTLAAAYMNIPVAHTMGGEVSGTIDESIRHAVTKFAHIHFPASRDAAERIVKLGELSEMVFRVGCPRIDLVAEILNHDGNGVDAHIFDLGVGVPLDMTLAFAIVSQHPARFALQDGWFVQFAFDRHFQQFIVGNAGPQEKRKARGQLRVADAIDPVGRNIGGRGLEAKDEFGIGENAAQGHFDPGFKRPVAAFLLIEAQQRLEIGVRG